MHQTLALLPPTAIERARESLPGVKEIAYFNAGTLGPLPVSSLAAMRAQLEAELVERQPSTLWDDLDVAREHARQQLAWLTGASTHQISLQAASHPGLSAALWGLRLQRDDVIVTTDEEHPGLLLPLRLVSEATGASIVELSYPDCPTKLQEFLNQLPPRTRVIALSHVSWLRGGVADVAELRSAVGPDIRIVIDGAQSAGAMDIASAVRASDAYSVSGQKWPLGPNGSGALVVQDPEIFAPTFAGFCSVVDPTTPLTSPFQTSGMRLEFGQENLVALVGITASIRFLAEVAPLANIERHATMLNGLLREALGDSISSDHLHGENHLLSISMENGGAVTLTQELLQEGFLVRPIGDTLLRISLAFWNTEDEVRALARALCAAL